MLYRGHIFIFVHILEAIIENSLPKLYVLFPLKMEDGGVDRTVIDCWQHQLGQMVDFSPFLTYKNLMHLKLWVYTKSRTTKITSSP